MAGCEREIEVWRGGSLTMGDQEGCVFGFLLFFFFFFSDNLTRRLES